MGAHNRAPGMTTPLALLAGSLCLWACGSEQFTTFGGACDNRECQDAESDTLVTGPDGNDAMGENHPIDVVWVDDAAETGVPGLDAAADSDGGSTDAPACTSGATHKQCGPTCPEGYAAIEYCWGTCGCGSQAMLTCKCN